ncbi:MAG: hypothetical protein CMD14_00830 [Flavobacteriales bacterium]|nr:hypothetical protein [Flavobacteriales bacterium]
MDIYKPSKEFDFNLFTLDNPQPVQGGSYFTRIVNKQDKPFYIQLPKCTTKQGIVKTNRGLYCDLMYNKNLCDDLIEWILALEKYLQRKINDKKEIWFTSEITEDDIESMMSPVYRLYKSGKNLLIRTFLDLDKTTNTGKCMVYNEDEIKLSVDSITNTVNIIPLIKIEGIKFTSKSFDIEIKLVQSMILNKEPELMQTCMIKKDNIPNDNNKVKTDENIIHTVQSQHDEGVTQNKVIKEQPDEEPSEENSEEADEESHEEPSEESSEELHEEPSEEPDKEFNEETDTQVVGNNVITSEVNQDNSDLHEKDSIKDTIKHSDSIKDTDDKSILDYEESDSLVKSDTGLEEININPDGDDFISIRNPKEIYEEIYKVARNKAKKMRAASIEAFLEAKRIKSQYVLDDIEDSDSEDYTDDEVNGF